MKKIFIFLIFLNSLCLYAFEEAGYLHSQRRTHIPMQGFSEKDCMDEKVLSVKFSIGRYFDKKAKVCHLYCPGRSFMKVLDEEKRIYECGCGEGEEFIHDNCVFKKAPPSKKRLPPEDVRGMSACPNQKNDGPAMSFSVVSIRENELSKACPKMVNNAKKLGFTAITIVPAFVCHPDLSQGRGDNSLCDVENKTRKLLDGKPIITTGPGELTRCLDYAFKAGLDINYQPHVEFETTIFGKENWRGFANLNPMKNDYYDTVFKEMMTWLKTNSEKIKSRGQQVNITAGAEMTASFNKYPKGWEQYLDRLQREVGGMGLRERGKKGPFVSVGINPNWNPVPFPVEVKESMSITGRVRDYIVSKKDLIPSLKERFLPKREEDGRCPSNFYRCSNLKPEETASAGTVNFSKLYAEEMKKPLKELQKTHCEDYQNFLLKADYFAPSFYGDLYRSTEKMDEKKPSIFQSRDNIIYNNLTMPRTSGPKVGQIQCPGDYNQQDRLKKRFDVGEFAPLGTIDEKITQKGLSDFSFFDLIERGASLKTRALQSKGNYSSTFNFTKVKDAILCTKLKEFGLDVFNPRDEKTCKIFMGHPYKILKGKANSEGRNEDDALMNSSVFSLKKAELQKFLDESQTSLRDRKRNIMKQFLKFADANPQSRFMNFWTYGHQDPFNVEARNNLLDPLDPELVKMVRDYTQKRCYDRTGITPPWKVKPTKKKKLPCTVLPLPVAQVVSPVLEEKSLPDLKFLMPQTPSELAPSDPVEEAPRVFPEGAPVIQKEKNEERKAQTSGEEKMIVPPLLKP